MAEPWTQFVQVRWRPDLGFFEQRTAVLRDLEGDGLLGSFRLESDHTSVQLGDRGHLLELTPQGLVVSAVTPEPDPSLLERSAMLALARLEPARVTRFRASFQQLVPLADEYDPARANAAEALFGEWGQPLGIEDWALLIDGRHEEEALSTNIEFGIVSQQEIPARLNRRVGRISSASQPPVDWRSFDLPEVALFVDSNWISLSPPEGILGDSFVDFWGRARQQSDALVSHLLEAQGLQSLDDPTDNDG